MINRNLLIVFLVLPFLFGARQTSGQNSLSRRIDDFDRGAVFDEVSSAVIEHFYDPDFNEAAWKQRAIKSRKRAANVKNLDDFSNEINGLLASLNASHTFYYSRDNPKRYQLLGVFNKLFENQIENCESLFNYDGIGIDTITIESENFVCSVYDGLPAANAGMMFGDQILSVDGRPFHPIQSFAGKSKSNVAVEILRANRKQFVSVAVEELDGRSMFEKAMMSSVRIIQRSGKNIGYLHVWSYAGQKYHEQIRSTLLWGKISKCDSVIIDLRDGWGGADVNYINLFRPPIIEVHSKNREGDASNYSGVWQKPVVLLTNSQTTSGKELYAYAFKKLNIGKVVGEQSAGAVVAGRIFLLSNGDVLYLAVTDISVDGIRLEGVGVAPDIEVKRDIRMGQNDVQLHRAIELLLKNRNKK